MRAELVEKRYDREFLKKHDLRVHHLIATVSGVRDGATLLAAGALALLDPLRTAKNFGGGTYEAFARMCGLKLHGSLVATFLSVPAKELDPSMPDGVYAYSCITAHPGEQVSRSEGRMLAFAEMQAGNHQLKATARRDSVATFAELIRDGLGSYPAALREEVACRVMSCRDRPDDRVS
jgi:hypothetical protein